MFCSNAEFLSFHLKDQQIEDAPRLCRPSDLSRTFTIDASLRHDRERLIGELVQLEVDHDRAEDDDECNNVQLEEERVAHVVVGRSG